jgi:hypothetical protein
MLTRHYTTHRSVGLTSGEEVGNQLLDLGDTGGSSDQDNLVDLSLVHLGILQDLLDGVHRGSEQVLTKLFEPSTGDRGVEVDTVEQGVDLDRGLSGRRQGPLGTLTCGSESSNGTGVGGQVLLVLPLELLDEVVDETVVKVLSSQVSVSGSSLDLVVRNC